MQKPFSRKCRQGQPLPRALYCRSLFPKSKLYCDGRKRLTGGLGFDGGNFNPGGSSGVLAAALNLPTCRKRVGPASSELGLFAARLGLGELRCMGRQGRFLHAPPPPAAATSEAAGGEVQGGAENSGHAVAALQCAHQAAADFLSACPIYFVADASGRLVAASYRAADPQVIPSLTAAAATAAAAGAASSAAPAASTPAHAALSVGVYFMSPVDAADYLHAITGGALRSPLMIRAVPLSKAYASLRYVHPKLRAEAARAASAPSISEKAFPLLHRLSQAVQQLLGWEARGARLRCVLLPDTQTLSEEIKRQRGAPFRGVPVFSLPPLKVERGSSLHTVLLQQRQRSTSGSKAATKRVQPSHYQLVPVETSPNHWVLAVQFKGCLRAPVFCSREDAHTAYAAFAASLPSRLLSARTTLRVHALEALLDKLALRAFRKSMLNTDANAHGLMRPLLLPALQNFL
ncbi:hypothetical protein Esti_006691 [Eimeria stiedai]